MATVPRSARLLLLLLVLAAAALLRERAVVAHVNALGAPVHDAPVALAALGGTVSGTAPPPPPPNGPAPPPAQQGPGDSDGARPGFAAAAAPAAADQSDLLNTGNRKDAAAAKPGPAAAGVRRPPPAATPVPVLVWQRRCPVGACEREGEGGACKRFRQDGNKWHCRLSAAQAKAAPAGCPLWKEGTGFVYAYAPAVDWADASQHRWTAAVRGGSKAMLFLGIMSGPQHANRREGQRRSFLQHPAIKAGLVSYRFFIGKPVAGQAYGVLGSDAAAVSAVVAKEAVAKRDVELIGTPESYDMLSEKTLEILGYGARQAPLTMKVDDDSYVALDAVLEVLRQQAAKAAAGGGSGKLERLALGKWWKKAPVNRQQGSKWYVSPGEYAPKFFPSYPNGAGYILTADVASWAHAVHKMGTLKSLRFEDVSVGLWLLQFWKVTGKAINMCVAWYNEVGCPLEGELLGHYISPRRMACLWALEAAGVPFWSSAQAMAKQPPPKGWASCCAECVRNGAATDAKGSSSCKTSSGDAIP